MRYIYPFNGRTKKGGAGKRKRELMKWIALFLIVPDTSLLFPAALRGLHTPLSLPMETGKTRNNKQ